MCHHLALGGPNPPPAGLLWTGLWCQAVAGPDEPGAGAGFLLLKFAYAYEQVTGHRRPPPLFPALP